MVAEFPLGTITTDPDGDALQDTVAPPGRLLTVKFPDVHKLEGTFMVKLSPGLLLTVMSEVNCGCATVLSFTVTLTSANVLELGVKVMALLDVVNVCGAALPLYIHPLLDDPRSQS